MSTQNQGKQPRSVPPPPPKVASHSRPNLRRQSMDDLLDDFIVRANQRVSSIRSRQWDLLVPAEEVDVSQIISDEPPVAVHAAPAAQVATVIVAEQAASAPVVVPVPEPVLASVPAPVASVEPTVAQVEESPAAPATAQAIEVVAAQAVPSAPEVVAPAVEPPATVVDAAVDAAPAVEAKVEQATAPEPSGATTQPAGHKGNKKKNRDRQRQQSQAMPGRDDRQEPVSEVAPAATTTEPEPTPEKVEAAKPAAVVAAPAKAPVRSEAAPVKSESRPRVAPVPLEPPPKSGTSKGTLVIGMAVAAGLAVGAMYYLQNGL